MKSNIDNNFKRIRLDFAQKPHDGYVVQIHRHDFWLIYNDGNESWILTNRQGIPVCNENPEILKNMYLYSREDITMERLETVYIPWETSGHHDYY